jgi:carbonic anhydrase
VPDIDELLARQARRAQQDSRPKLHVAVVTCMDCRIDPVWLLGLQIGDVHILRNAGGLITDDVLRSLALSQRALGTRAVLVVQHPDCGMRGCDDAAFRGALAAETGAEPRWDVPGFDDVREQVRSSVRSVRACPWLPHRDEVRGAIYDVATGVLTAFE